MTLKQRRSDRYSIKYKTQTIAYLGCQTHNKNCGIIQTKFVFFFFSPTLSYTGYSFLSLRNISKNMEKFKFTKTLKANSRYKKHKSSHSDHITAPRLMHKYVSAYMSVCVSLNYQNDTFLILNHVFT